MRILVCIVVLAAALLHGMAAGVHMTKKQSLANDVWMLAGAVLAVAGTVVCLAGGGADWLIALAGFSCMAYAAVQNGRKSGKFHLQHHIVRIILFALIVMGMYFV